MEELLDYLMYALLGHSYSVKRCGINFKGHRQWLISFEESVSIVLDEHDINVIRFFVDNRQLDEESKERYSKFLQLFV